MAKGVHLFPSRTQKLSPYTSKVLGWKRPGRIDSCRLEQIRHTCRYALFDWLNENHTLCVWFRKAYSYEETSFDTIYTAHQLYKNQRRFCHV